jgi:hypothetical protein
MIPPVIVGSGYKYFTDCTTWNGGYPNNFLTQITIYFATNAGYTFQEGDVAVVAASNGMYPTQSGWTQLVNGANTDIWAKRLSSNSDNFDSAWTHAGGGYSLFTSGMYGFVYRSPYSRYGSISDSLYYTANENTYTGNAQSSGGYAIPAVSRPSFDDSEFYYRIDAVYNNEDYGSYYSSYYNYSPVVTQGGGVGSLNCANTYEFITTPGASIGLAMFNSTNLAGTAITFYPGTYVTSPSDNYFRVNTTTMWVRGWNPSQSGVML